jgi:hypothetical protein
MRRPVLSRPCANKAGDSQGGAALLWGEQPSSAAWGEPSRPGFPQRGNGKGGPISLLPQADCCPFVFESFAQSMIIFCVTPSLPTAKTPCFHSHSWSCLLRCLLVSSFFNRVLPSQNRTEASRFRDVRSRYSSQSPEPGDLYKNTNSELKLLPSSNPIFVRRYAAAHTLRRSPTGDAAAPPASVPPPQLPASLHSSRHARPV